MENSVGDETTNEVGYLHLSKDCEKYIGGGNGKNRWQQTRTDGKILDRTLEAFLIWPFENDITRGRGLG